MLKKKAKGRTAREAVGIINAGIKQALTSTELNSLIIGHVGDEEEGGSIIGIRGNIEKITNGFTHALIEAIKDKGSGVPVIMSILSALQNLGADKTALALIAVTTRKAVGSEDKNLGHDCGDPDCDVHGRKGTSVH